MNGERPHKGGAPTGLAAADRVPDHLAEAADRLRAIARLSKPDFLPELGVVDRLHGIHQLVDWSALHLAVAREYGEAA